MDDKRLKAHFSKTSDQELQFTKENRQKVFDQINKIEKDSLTQKKSSFSIQRFAPVIVSLFLLGICLFLFMPSLLPGIQTKETNITTASNSVNKKNKVTTTLFSVKSKEMDNRIYLNLLLTYHKDKKMFKVVSLPTETYAPISKNKDGTDSYDKLMFAYKNGDANNIKTAVSKLFNLPIDYYSVIDVETFSSLIESVNGIEFNLPEDIRVRAITQAAFEFERGIQNLSGEEVIAILMAATEGVHLKEENFISVLQTTISKLETEMPPTQLKEKLSKIETNISLDLLENQHKNYSIEFVSLRNGMTADSTIVNETEGKFYYKFDQDFLKKISDNLTK